MAVAAPLREDYYESGNAPHEALGRAARKLMSGGALYLGGGVGIEKLTTGAGASSYSLANGGKTEKFAGPLTAVMRAFALAGGSTSPDTPGGTTKVADPAAAARLRELIDEERRTQQDIERYTARLAAKTSGPLGVPSPGALNDDQWEARRLAELKRELTQLRAERATLLATGKVEEAAAETGKPGTNWKQVGPAARKKVDPLVKHWMSKPHPFTACYNELAPEKGAEAAKRICAVVKDMGMKTTKWRKGGKGKKLSEAELFEFVFEQAALAEDRLAGIDEVLGGGMALTLAESELPADPFLATLSESAVADLTLLGLVGHPLGVLAEEFVFGAEVAGRVPFVPA